MGAEMTSRDRLLETLLFGAPDRIPLVPGHGRESTMRAWHSQGLPEEVEDVNEYAYRQVGGKLPWPSGGGGFYVNERMIPEFEEKVIERGEHSQIVQDWKGNICEISNEFGVEYLRSAIDFVTRRWIKCPVENRGDWEEMKSRYDPKAPSRFPEDAERLGKEYAERDWFLQLGFPGPFWQLREWVGFEGLCMLFYDNTELVRDMLSFWKDYISELLERAVGYVAPDGLIIFEDMAFKEHSMISPDMVREFLLPIYAQWGEIIRGVDCPIYSVDSDGFIGQLIPIWMEAGINHCDPVEVAAGNDLVNFRAEFGRGMAYSSGVDKRAIAKGGRAIELELERLTPVTRDGGFIPGCDHGVPSNVSWPDYVRYVKLLAECTGWL